MPSQTDESWAKRYGPWVAAVATVFAITGGLITAIYFVGDGRWITKPAYAQDARENEAKRQACDVRIAGTEKDVAVIKATLESQEKSFDALAKEVSDLTRYLRDREIRERRRR